MVVYVGLLIGDVYDNVVFSVILVQDCVLLVLVCMMVGQVGWNDGVLVVLILFVVLELFVLLVQDVVYYQVWMDDEMLLVGCFDFFVEFDFVVFYLVYIMIIFEGKLLCVVSYICVLFDEGMLCMVVVLVGQIMQGWQEMIDDQWYVLLWCQIVLLLLVISLVVLGLMMELWLLLVFKDELVM